jgi:hypothetical protein
MHQSRQDLDCRWPLTFDGLDQPTLATFLNRILLYDVQRTQRLVTNSRT